MNRHDFWNLVALLGATLILLWRYLFTWPTPLIYPVSNLGTDLPREVWPLAQFIADSFWQTGKIPLWRPYQLSGSPLIGHPVAPVLYPLHWLVLIMPLPLAFNLNALFHLWWCGVGLYLYLRLRMMVRPEAALVGAIVLAHSPKWIAHLSGGHGPTLVAIAWAPWVWLTFASYWATGMARWAVLLGVALAAQVLNHGTYLAISCVVLGVATFGQLGPGLVPWLKRAVLGWGVALVVMLGLSAGQILPLLELLPYSTRTALSFDEAAFGSLPSLLLVSLLLPPDLKFPEWFVVPGVGAAMLVVFGWTQGWSRLERRWAVVSLMGLAMSLGSNTPLYLLLYHLPGFSMFRNPSRWSILTLYALAVLVAYAADKWLNKRSIVGRRLLLALTSMEVFYVIAAGMEIVWPELLPFDVVPAGLVALALGAVLVQQVSRWKWIVVLVIVVADLWWIAAGLVRPEPESSLSSPDPVAELLAEPAALGERSFAPYGGVDAPALVMFNLRAADGYDPFQLAAYAELAQRAAGCAFEGYAVAVPPTQASPEATLSCPQFRPTRELLALLNIRYVILPAPMDLPDASLVHVDAARRVYDIGPGLGRAFGVASWRTVSSTDCVGQLIDMDPNSEALVESALPAVAGGADQSVRSSAAGVDWEVFVVHAESPGILIRSETWAPGWRVSIEDKPAELLRVDCALQGVWIDKGDHQVRFEYQPLGWRIGWPISVGSFIGLVTGCAVAWRRRAT